MDAVAEFLTHNIIVIYFFYGLAFFSMGLLVWLESGRASEFRLARAMGPLAGFGIIHGLHEWFEMFQRLGATQAANIPSWLLLDNVRIAHLVLSFLLLIIFGVRLIYSSRKEDGNEQLFAYLSAGVLLGIWLISVFVTRQLYPRPADFITVMDVLARYILGIPGALLAAWAIVLEQRTFRARGMPGFGRDLLRAALALTLYGLVGQAFPKPSYLFPSNIINADLFLGLFGIPVQLFRAVVGTLMAVFVVRALRAFDLEQQQHLALANEARLTAQRKALEVQQQARAETEQLNQELQMAVQDLSLLFEFSRSMAETLDLKVLLQQAIAQIVNTVPRITGGQILLQEKPDGPLLLMASAGYQSTAGTTEAEQVKKAHRVGRYIVETGLPACYANGELHSLDSSLNLKSLSLDTSGGNTLGVPLMVQERVAGSLVLSVQIEAPPLTARDLALIDTLAGQLSIAVENAMLYREVQEREALRGELLHRIVSAQESERQRIARELHDGAGQMLTALGLGIAAASESVQSDPSLAARQLAELKTFSGRALQEVRDVIGNLRPSVLDDLGLVPALHGQSQEFEARTGVRTEFVVNGRRRRVQPEIETVVFRIAQEALTNIAKHADAESVVIWLTFADDALHLTVRDDGRGFTPAEALGTDTRRRAWGLLGMQERVALVGGSCEIESQPGAGTTIRVNIPLTQVGVNHVED